MPPPSAAVALASATSGYVRQIAQEPCVGLGHVMKNLSKIQNDVVGPAKADLLALLQAVRESRMEMQSIQSGEGVNSGGNGSGGGGGALAALDSATTTGESILEHIQKARERRAKSLDAAQGKMVAALLVGSSAKTSDNDFSQWYGDLFESPTKGAVAE